MRAFITHTTENYEQVVLNLAKSIQRYSNYPLVVYTIDYDGGAELQELAICKRLDLGLPVSAESDFVEKNGNQYVNRSTYRTYMTLAAKIDVMIDSIDSKIEEWCYVDADCVANTNIDELFDYMEQISDYPLATLGPQEYAMMYQGEQLIGNPFWKEDGTTDTTATLEWPLMEFFGMKPEQRTPNYRTTNILIGNAECKEFLQTWRDAKNTFAKLFDTYRVLPFHEETLFNVLVWQRDDKYLPMSYINIEGAHTVEHFLAVHNTELNRLSDFYTLPADKSQIKVFHGEKRTEEIEKVFALLGVTKKPLKILFLAPHLSTGGMPAFLLRRIQMMKKWTNHEIFVVEWSMYADCYVVQRNEILKLIPEDHFMSMGGLGESDETFFEKRAKIVDLCYEWGIDIIHLDEIPEGFDGFSPFPIEIQKALYAPIRPWKIVETCHNVWFKPDEMKKIEPDAYATIVALHQEKTFRKKQVMTEMIQFPADLPFGKPTETREEILTEWGYRTTGEFHICNIGLWTRGKNQAYALEIARRLYELYGNTYQFHFIGNQASNFEHYWRPLMESVPPNCHIHGERADGYKWLIASDVMLFTSTWECNPIVLAEAAAYGTKTMAFNMPQYGEHWKHRITHLRGDLFTDVDNLIKLVATERSKSLPNGLDGHRFATEYEKLYMKLNQLSQFRHFTEEAPSTRYEVRFDNGCKFTNLHTEACDVQFFNNETGQLVYTCKDLQQGHWAKPSIKFYTDWKVVATWPDRAIEWRPDLRETTCVVDFDSSSLGDTLAFMEVVRAWKEQKEIDKVYVKTFKNFLFNWDDYNMDGIYSLEPGSALPEHDHLFQLGFHMGDPAKGEPAWYPHLNKRDWRAQYLGDIAADALGFTGNAELRPSLSFVDTGRPVEEKYVVIGLHSTAQAKYWNNPTGWQEIVDWHKQNGYRVFMASHEGDGYMGNHYPSGVEEMPKDLQSVENWIHHAEYFIGLSSGLSWLAWAVGAKIVLISGFTPEECEFKDKTLRIIDKSVCNSCWKWGHFDRGDWNWCPAHKGTEKQFECTKKITGASVIKQIEEWKKSQ